MTLGLFQTNKYMPSRRLCMMIHFKYRATGTHFVKA